MTTDTLDRPTVGERKVDAFRGRSDTTVSHQWFNRPADQRYLSVQALRDAVRARWNYCDESVRLLSDLRFEADPDSANGLLVHSGQSPMAPTNWAFTQLCSTLRLPAKDGTIGVPATYLRSLPTKLAAANLNAACRMQGLDAETKLFGYFHRDARELRAATSASYGRISDADVAQQVVDICDRGSWKVPGVMHWSKGTYDPHVPVTLDTTTLFASDRDVFMFLVDDLHPIEVGTLPDGSPDLMFRGFIVSNSEVGSRKLVITVFYLRGVCANRCLWGIEGKKTLSIRHNSRAPERFLDEAMPQLESFTRKDPQRLVEGVKAAKEATVAKSAEDQVKFLKGFGFSEKTSRKVIDIGRETEGDPLTAWDFAQALTRYSQDAPHQDERVAIEEVAGKILDKATS